MSGFFMAPQLVDELRRAHGAHTVILYGSRAGTDPSPESDIDVVAYADIVEPVRDARLWHGLYLDAFIAPTAEASKAPDEGQLKLLDSRVLLDERGLAAPLLVAVEALHAAGPPPLPEHEARMRRTWAHKMLGRVRRGDLEAHFRHHWLLYQLLEDDFALHGEWYRGPKRALQELAERRPATHAAFAKALPPHAQLRALEELVVRVAGPGAQ